MEIALRLASEGLFVFPCQSGGDRAKSPFVNKWREVSTTDDRQITNWWRQYPGAAAGIDLGKSDLIVIDADCHEGGANGVAALYDFMREKGYNPKGVPVVETPNNGMHYYFRQPKGRQLGNGTGSLPPGIDVRGHGGYAIAPGTVMQDRRVYKASGSISGAPELPTLLVEVLEHSSEGH